MVYTDQIFIDQSSVGVTVLGVFPQNFTRTEKCPGLRNKIDRLPITRVVYLSQDVPKLYVYSVLKKVSWHI